MKTTKVYYILQYQITNGPHKGKWVPLTYWDGYTYEEYWADSPKELLKRIAEEIYYNMEPHSAEFMDVIEKHYKLVEVHETIETLEVPLEDYRNNLTKE
jgi:hypothetical protein